MDDCTIRPAKPDNLFSIERLYKRVAAVEGGLARTESEITSEYIIDFVTKSQQNGVEFVAVQNESHQVVGEIHCYNTGLKVFAHVFGDLTIAVDPLYQRKGIGRKLFTQLLKEVKNNRPNILRVELIVRESNKHAVKFYESLGFKREGKLENRIRSVDGGFEADIFMAWRR